MLKALPALQSARCGPDGPPSQRGCCSVTSLDVLAARGSQNRGRREACHCNQFNTAVADFRSAAASPKNCSARRQALQSLCFVASRRGGYHEETTSCISATPSSSSSWR